MTGDTGMSSMDTAWPFVVTRNRRLDWRPIVAPEFLTAVGGEYLLVYEADLADEPCPSPVAEHVVPQDRYGPLTLLMRSIPANADLIGESPETPLVDGAGRPVRVIEGLVLRGRHSGGAAYWEERFRAVHEITRKEFPRFWAQDDESATAVNYPPVTHAHDQTASMVAAARSVIGGHDKDSTRLSRQIVLLLLAALGLALLVILYLAVRKRLI